MKYPWHRTLAVLLLSLPTVLFAGINSDLVNAVGAGEVEEVKALLAKGAKPNAIGVPESHGSWYAQPVLHIAAALGHAEIVELLLKAGAKVNAVDSKGWTALHAAGIFSRADTASILLKYGANVHAKLKNNQTALHLSCNMTLDAQLVKVLLDAGAKVNVKDKNAQTPLMGAASNGSLEAVKMLLDAGAKVNVRNYQGTTPIKYAKEWCMKGAECTEIVELLREHGAKE